MMTASNVDEYPTIIFESGDNVTAVHLFIIHTIHTKSIYSLALRDCLNRR
jgi:hypothetical protein